MFYYYFTGILSGLTEGFIKFIRPIHLATNGSRLITAIHNNNNRQAPVSGTLTKETGAARTRTQVRSLTEGHLPGREQNRWNTDLTELERWNAIQLMGLVECHPRGSYKRYPAISDIKR